MLAKAVANNTKAAYIRANGSEFVQKVTGMAVGLQQRAEQHLWRLECSFAAGGGADWPMCVQYLGEGPRMVRDVFRLAKENSPAIIFIDEIDSIATKRFDAQTGADREVLSSNATVLYLPNLLMVILASKPPWC